MIVDAHQSLKEKDTYVFVPAGTDPNTVCPELGPYKPFGPVTNRDLKASPTNNAAEVVKGIQDKGYHVDRRRIEVSIIE